MDTSGREPNQVGFPIHTVIEATTDADFKKEACAIFHDDTYKLSITEDDDSTTNDREWWLDLRPAVFPSEQNWYGPHTGDTIFQYETFDGELIGVEEGTAQVWKLDVEATFGSMANSTVARTSIATTGRLQAPGMKQAKIDAYGFTGEMDASTAIDLEVDIDRGTAEVTDTWTAPSTLAARGTYTVVRPLKRPGHDAQITITHDEDNDVEIHSLYLRTRERRRQAEKQSGSSQA
jgi:hypothetical protein